MTTEVDTAPIHGGLSDPASTCLIPNNTLKPRSIVGPNFAIPHILRDGYDAQIRPTVVEWLSVHVISMEAGAEGLSDDQMVHEYDFPIDHARSINRVETPAPLLQPFIVLGIHRSVSNNASLDRKSTRLNSSHLGIS